jgi:hypothetical protein
MASPTLQTLQNPILLPPSVLLSRLGGFPHPCGRNLPHLEARVVPGVHHAVVHTQRLRLEVVPRASALRPPARGAYGSPQRRVHLPRQHNQSQCYAQLPRTPSPLPSGQERTLRLAVRSLPRAHTLHPLPTHSRPCSHARTHLVPAGGGEAVQQLPLPPRSELVARHWAVRTGERGTTKRARNAVATNHNPLQSPIISSTRFWPDAGVRPMQGDPRTRSDSPHVACQFLALPCTMLRCLLHQPRRPPSCSCPGRTYRDQCHSLGIVVRSCERTPSYQLAAAAVPARSCGASKHLFGNGVERTACAEGGTRQ